MKDPLEYFGKGHSCSQAVLTAFAEDIGLEPPVCRGIASAFGGGIAGSQRICGAVSGGLMVIGMVYFDDAEPVASKQVVTEKSLEFMELFTKSQGTIDCLELLGTSMEEARRKDLFSTKCSSFVESACSIIQSIIN